MGLFSSEYQTFVATVTQRVIKDELLPNSLKTGVIRAIINPGDVVDEMMEQLVGGIGVKAEQLFRYGAEHYTHGLPSGQFTTANAGLEDYTAVLTAQEGAPVSIVYYRYGHANLLHLGWMQLIAQTGYNPATNEIPSLSAPTGWPVYLKDMVVVVPSLASYDSTALELWGRAARAGYTPERPFTGVTQDLIQASPIEVDPAAIAPYVRVTYTWQPIIPGSGSDGPTRPNLEDSFTIQLASLFDAGADYYQAKYTVGGVTKYAVYASGAGTHPALDNLYIPEPTTAGTFFPFAYFRYNKQSEIADKTTAAYTTTKKLVKYLGMDFDQVADAIDQNPNIADVEQAMVTFSVPAVTTNPLEQRYLFDFFQEMWASDPNQISTLTSAAWKEFFAGSLKSEDPIKGGLLIQDKRFKMALTHSGITRSRVAGSIGVVGSHASGTQTATIDRKYVDPVSGDVQVAADPIKQHFYRRQVSTGLYDEIVVTNLKMRYHIFDVYTVTADEEQDILLIPLDHALTEQYSVVDRETLYARSLHYIFNSRVVVEIKWYQQDLFQLVIIVVAVVLSAGTIGEMAGQIAAAVAAGTAEALTTLLMSMLFKLLESIVIKVGLKLFVKAVGGEAALILAAVAAIAAGYQVLQAGSVAGAPWAQDLLKLSTGLTTAISANLKDEFNALAGEWDALQAKEKAESEDLAGAQKLLEQNRWLSPITIFGESPDAFYNRTIHSGNIGITSIGAISNYVEIALRLPDLEDSLGDRAYA